MLFKQKTTQEKANQKIIAPIPWDKETTEHFTKSDRFDIYITHVTKRNSYGCTIENKAVRDPCGYEVGGIILYPKLIHVEISFHNAEKFGGWFYHLYNNSTPSNQGHPFLDFCVSDPEFKIREDLYEGHKAAILSGRNYSFARFWKRVGDGKMTEKDIEHGWSYESRYPLLGIHCWSEIESKLLPNWAVPHSNGRFSLENLPERYNLKL